MLTVVIVIHLMIVTAMIGLVLLQRSEGGGLGMGGGGGGGFLTSRGTSNVLTRSTAILAAGFFATSLALSIIAGLDRKPTSILPNTPTTQTPAPGTPAAPEGSLLDRLRGGAPATPAAPAEPAAPAAPAAPAPQ